MTIRIQFVVLDDLADSNGEQLPVGDDGETVVISLDGIVRELHLTRPHADQLRADMKPWLDAGHQPGEQPEMPEMPELPGRRARLKGQGRRREIPGTRDFYRELREWAEAAGIGIPTAGKRPGKQNYVYDKVMPRYLAHLQETAAGQARDGAAATARGVAMARLDMARLLGLLEEDAPAAAVLAAVTG